MTKEETVKIMTMLGAFYSGSKNNAKMQAAAWHMVLEKYDFEIAQKAVLNFAENDTREYATFPAVGVIVREIRNQQYLEAKPIKEVIRAISYGKGYEDISDDAKRIISEEVYNKWLKVDAEEFAAKSEFFAKMLSTGHTLMLE